MRGSLTLDAGSGGVEVTDMTGDLKIENGSGGTTLDGVRGGRLNMDVGSGSLRGRSIDVTEFVADVGSGGVRLSGVKTPKLHLETGSGSTEVEFLAEPDDVSIEAGSGGVTLRMPAATSAMVDIETGSGGIDTDFEVKLSAHRTPSVARHDRRGQGTHQNRIRLGFRPPDEKLRERRCIRRRQDRTSDRR